MNEQTLEHLNLNIQFSHRRTFLKCFVVYGTCCTTCILNLFAQFCVKTIGLHFAFCVFVSVMFGWYLGRVSVVSRSRLGGIWVMLWWFLGHAYVVSRSCFCVVSQSCHNRFNRCFCFRPRPRPTGHGQPATATATQLAMPSRPAMAIRGRMPNSRRSTEEEEEEEEQKKKKPKPRKKNSSSSHGRKSSRVIRRRCSRS